jgi:hypothetical protein
VDVTGLDALSALGRDVVAVVSSGGLAFAALAFAAALAVSFCLGRLVERAVTDLRRTTELPPRE